MSAIDITVPDIDAAVKAAAPPVPADTCPMIDPLSVLLDAMGADLSSFREGLDYNRRSTVDKDEVRELLLDAQQNLASARLRLEEIRVANEQLRASGCYWREAHRTLAERIVP